MNRKPERANRDLGAMEYFILTLIGRLGLTSLYSFKEEAGLEPGSIRPALNRLEEKGLITRMEPGQRRRRNLALTSAGHGVLDSSWMSCVHDHVDAESVMRSTFVAWSQGGPSVAADYLRQIGESRRDKAEQKMNEATYLERSQTRPLSSYAWMRISQEAHRRKAESEAFLSMSRSIQERFCKHANNTTQSAATSQ